MNSVGLYRAPDGPGSETMSADLVFTGFEPFGEFPVNPSFGVAESAASAAGPGAIAELLPVTYRTATEYGPRALSSSIPPRALVHVGLSGDRDWISIERRARNESDGKPDNDGEVPLGRLEQDGPAAVETGFDVEAFATALASRTGRDVRVSESAGGFVCNAIYYQSLLCARGTQVLFIHVPPLAEEEQRVVGEALGKLMMEVT